jgi:dipeptidyl aminopeptidase/acylaminoacyl peptidase
MTTTTGTTTTGTTTTGTTTTGTARRLRRIALALGALTLGAGLLAPPAVATAGGTAEGEAPARLVFNRGGNIWVAAVDGSGARPLTAFPRGGAGHPRWSPDGSRIAYTRGGAVWTMRADGTGRTRLFPGSRASWSPDGRSLAYWTGDAVVARDLPAGPERVVEYYADSGGCPWERSPGPSTSWAADGEVVFGVVERGGVSGPCGSIASLTAVQKAPAVETGASPAGVQLTGWPVAGLPPAVDAAPTGSAYLVATDAGSRDGLARLYVGGAGPRRQLTTDRGVDTPSFTPDGRGVYYTQHLPGGPWTVKRVAADGRSAPVQVLVDASQPDVRRAP